MKEKFLRLKAMALAGVIALSSPSLAGCSIDGNNNNSTETVTVHFNEGQHVISVPISESKEGTYKEYDFEFDVRTQNVQYKAYPGYVPIGISLASYGTINGPTSNTFGGGAIIYANTEVVACSSNHENNSGTYDFVEFGTPVDKKDISLSSDENYKEFDVGQHIISTPFDKNKNVAKNIYQYECPEGYQIVGIGSTAYGEYGNMPGGGVILYVNTVPVKCKIDNCGYTTFGTPIELEKTIK